MNQVYSLSTPMRRSILLLAALLLLLLSPMAQTAQAASDGGWQENIELTGNFDGTFTLDSNTSHIFQAENAAPGDSWTGDITIQNHAEDPMEVALLSIVSELDDLALYNALTLNIQVDGTEIYSGSYGKTPEQITSYYELSPGESMVLNVTVEFPAHYGNEMISKQMNSTWTFDARYPDNGSDLGEQPSDKPSSDSSEKPTGTHSEVSSEKPSATQTGNDLSEDTTTTAIYILVAAFCLLAIVVTWLRIHAEKRRIDD